MWQKCALRMHPRAPSHWHPRTSPSFSVLLPVCALFAGFGCSVAHILACWFVSLGLAWALSGRIRKHLHTPARTGPIYMASLSRAPLLLPFPLYPSLAVSLRSQLEVTESEECHIRLTALRRDADPPGEESKVLAVIVWGKANKSVGLGGALGAALDMGYDTLGAIFKGDSHTLPEGMALFGRRRRRRRLEVAEEREEAAEGVVVVASSPV